MHNLGSRLAKVEQLLTPPPPGPRYVRGIMDYDERGNPATLSLEDTDYTPMAGESEDELCDRAMREAGLTGCNLMLIRLVRSDGNGRPAPGFERFEDE